MILQLDQQLKIYWFVITKLGDLLLFLFKNIKFPLLLLEDWKKDQTQVYLIVNIRLPTHLELERGEGIETLIRQRWNLKGVNLKSMRDGIPGRYLCRRGALGGDWTVTEGRDGRCGGGREGLIARSHYHVSIVSCRATCETSLTSAHYWNLWKVSILNTLKNVPCLNLNQYCTVRVGGIV